MTIKPARVFSDLPIPPGEVLAEEIAARGITLPELAARIGRPLWVVDEIIRGKQAIDRDTAIPLSEAVDGIDADFWRGLETRYRMALARQDEETTPFRVLGGGGGGGCGG